MGMFGNPYSLQKPIDPAQLGPIDGQTPSMIPGGGLSPATPPTTAAAPHKGFDWGNFITNFALNVGASYGNPMALSTLQDQRQMRTLKWQQQKVQEQQQAEFQRQKSLYDYQLANPKPANNDTQNDYAFIQQTLGEEAAKQYLRNVAAGQPIPVKNADGTYSVLTRDQFAPKIPQPAPPGVTFTPLDSAPPVNASTAAPILRGAASSTVISPADAARMRASLGPNGQAAFQQWMQQHNVTIGGQ